MTVKQDDTLVVVAKAGAPHGVRGEIRVKSFTGNPGDFAAYGPLQAADGRIFTVQSARPQKEMFIVRFREVATREAAEALNGVELLVPRSALGALDDEDEFFMADLVGLVARNTDGEDIGLVAAVHDFGAGDILEIARTRGGSEMIAFTRATVPVVDLEGGFVAVAPPEEVSERDPDNEAGAS